MSDRVRPRRFHVCTPNAPRRLWSVGNCCIKISDFASKCQKNSILFDLSWDVSEWLRRSSADGEGEISEWMLPGLWFFLSQVALGVSGYEVPKAFSVAKVDPLTSVSGVVDGANFSGVASSEGRWNES